MVLETNITNILTSINEQNKLHASSLKVIGNVQGASTSGSAMAQAKELGSKLFSTTMQSFSSAK